MNAAAPPAVAVPAPKHKPQPATPSPKTDGKLLPANAGWGAKAAADRERKDEERRLAAEAELRVRSKRYWLMASRYVGGFPYGDAMLSEAQCRDRADAALKGAK